MSPKGNQLMKRSRILNSVFAMTLVFMCAGGLTACASETTETSDPSLDISDTSEGVAATVNGTEIGEKAITAYIESFRVAGDLADEESWAEWLIEEGYTPEDIRSDVVDYYVNKQLLRQAAEENGVEADADTIDSQVETMRSYYDSEDDWTAALESLGMTEASYRDMLELSALESGLMDVVATASDPSEEDLLTNAESYASTYDGAKKSSHILFSSDDEETAQEVLDMINAGEIDFADAAAEYSLDSSSEDGGNVGWDKFTTFVDEYQEALDELEEGEVSGLVTSSYGIHIIMCTEVFTAPDEVTSVDQLPDEFVELIYSQLEEESLEESFTTWYEEYEAAADIVINDMPEGLSYDVDLSAYETEDDEEEDSDTTTTVNEDGYVEIESSSESSDSTDEDSTDEESSDEETTEEESTEETTEDDTTEEE